MSSVADNKWAGDVERAVEEAVDVMTITATCTLCHHATEYAPTGIHIVISVDVTGNCQGGYCEFFCVSCRGLSHQPLVQSVLDMLVQAGVLVRYEWPPLREVDASVWETMLSTMPDAEIQWFFQAELAPGTPHA